MTFAIFLANPWPDALIVVLVVLLFLGPKRLPSLGRSLGEGMREFKDSITGKSGSEDEEAEQPAVSETSVSAPAATPQPQAAEPATTTEPPPAPSPEPAEPQEPSVASSERHS